MTIPEGVTSIGNYAFENCSGLTSVRIPTSVKSMGASPFSGCYNVTDITVPSEFSVKIIFPNSYDKLVSVTIPYGSKRIMKETCEGCVKIEDLEIPMGLETIEQGALEGLPFYERYLNSCEDGLVLLNGYVMGVKGECPSVLELEANATLIAGGAFLNCTGLELVKLSSGIEFINANAFLECESLKRVDVASLTDWLKIKFANAAANPLCYGAELYVDGVKVTNFVVPEGVAEIGEQAFAGQTAITNVTIPSSVMSIAPTAFVGCSNIVSATVGCPKGAAVGLLHRWGFNGDLKDSVGSSDATIVGNVTTDGRRYMTPGGSSGSAYIDLGDNLVPRECEAVTLEFWATQDARGSYDRIFDFGSMPAGYDFTRYDTSCYSPDNIRMDWKGNITSFGATGWSLSVGTEYHIAVVYEKGQGSRWVATYYIQDATGSGELFKVSCEADSGWSFASVGQTEWLLGQPLTCWDSCAKASYNEVRIWNRALTEEDFKTATEDGPDAIKMGTGRIRSIFPDSSIHSVRVNDDVADLPDGFFSDCTTLESVTLPDALMTVGKEAFKGCSSLAAIAIPSGVTNIGENAFLGCENLKRVDVATLEDWLKIKFVNAAANPLCYGAELYVSGEKIVDLVVPGGGGW